MNGGIVAVGVGVAVPVAVGVAEGVGDSVMTGEGEASTVGVGTTGSVGVGDTTGVAVSVGAGDPIGVGVATGARMTEKWIVGERIQVFSGVRALTNTKCSPTENGSPIVRKLMLESPEMSNTDAHVESLQPYHQYEVKVLEERDASSVTIAVFPLVAIHSDCVALASATYSLDCALPIIPYAGIRAIRSANANPHAILLRKAPLIPSAP